MSGISRNPEYVEGINSHSFEGFLIFFGCVCKGAGADWIAIALLLHGLWGVCQWRRAGEVPSHLGGGWIQFAEDMSVLSE